MRPTRIRDSSMIKIKKDGGITYINVASALRAFQALQFYFAQCGFLVTSHINLSNDVRSIDLTVHFDAGTYPSVAEWLTFSRKEIGSHSYYSDYLKQSIQVRTIDFYFDVKD